MTRKETENRLSLAILRHAKADAELTDAHENDDNEDRQAAACREFFNAERELKQAQKACAYP